MSEMFSQGEIDRIIEDSWHEWEEEEDIHPCKDCKCYISPNDCRSNGGCGDTISRQAVLSIIDESKEDDADEWMDYPWKVTPNLLMDEVRKLPPVTPSVIEDIKAEIKQKREENRNGEYDKIFELCLLIIDKHTKGVEE